MQELEQPRTRKGKLELERHRTRKRALEHRTKRGDVRAGTT